MAPIRIYTNSPIAAKPSGATPQTAAPDSSGQTIAAPPATITSSPTPSRTYPPAQPGAGPSMPEPTAAASIRASSAVRPTPTEKLNTDSPPPPQPAAAPVPPSSVARNNLPPPPKTGEKFVPPPTGSPAQPTAMPYPSQMSVPPPTTTYPAQQYGTSTTVPPSSSSQNLQHPPGYQQNVHASGLDQYQRSAMRQNQSSVFQDDDSEEGMWGAAKKWAQATGEKLVAAESEVWKRINKD